MRHPVNMVKKLPMRHIGRWSVIGARGLRRAEAAFGRLAPFWSNDGAENAAF